MSRWICPECDGPTNLPAYLCDRCCEKLLKKDAELAEERYKRGQAVIAAAKVTSEELDKIEFEDGFWLPLRIARGALREAVRRLEELEP